MRDTAEREQQIREQFKTLPQPYDQWSDRTLTQARGLGLTEADVPALLAIVDSYEDTEAKVAPDVYDYSAPVLAFGALVHMGSPEALEAGLSLLEPMDRLHDDMLTEVMGPTLALCGQGAIPHLKEYLQKEDALWARVAAIRALGDMAKADPAARDAVVGVLTEQLSKFENQDEDLNGSLVGALVELKAVESAEAIERAYAADAVELMVRGNWNTVREELGVPGLGLVTEEQASQKPFLPESLREISRLLASQKQPTKQKVGREVQRRTDGKISGRKSRGSRRKRRKSR